MKVNYIIENKSKDIAFGFLRLFFGFLFFLSLTDNSFGQVSGTVFRDFNANGVKNNTSTYNETFVAGITVKAYNSANVEVGSTTTNTSGAYSFTGLTLPLRIEFSGFQTEDYTAPAGTGNASSVQFYTAASTTANFGINYPQHYTSSANPDYLISQFESNRPPASDPSATAMLKTNYDARGTTWTTNTTSISKTSDIGGTWGLAYDRKNDVVYAASMAKRHSAMKDNNADGKEDLGAIYSVTTSGVSSLWLDIASLGIDVGLSVMPTIAARGLPTTLVGPSHDAAMYPLIGKIGLGDIEISDDYTKLYVMNLYDKKLYTIDIATKTLVGTGISVPDVCNAGTGNIRPFGLRYYRGKIYVGAICDGLTSQNINDVTATVFRLDGSTFTSVLSFPLNYTKGYAFKDLDGNQAEYGKAWRPWLDVMPATAFLSGGVPILVYPEPVLANIEFDIDGSMVLVFNDRLGHQGGYRNYGTNTSSTTLHHVLIGGDILRASYDGTTYTLESNGTAGSVSSSGVGNNGGPGGGEFYVGDRSNLEWNGRYHDELVIGGSLIMPGRGEVAALVTDPIQYYAGGVYFFDNANGDVAPSTDRYQLYPWTQDETKYGKANGLGDLELVSAPAPLEIGNRVWTDTDGDGIQDAGELGIDGKVVKLYLGATQVGQTTTANGGAWYFNNTNVNMNGATKLLPFTTYTIRVESAQFPSSHFLTIANTGGAGQPDVRDSDASLVSGNADITYTTGAYGQNNHTLDIGFTTVVACIAPSAITFTQVAPTCTGATANNNGTISLATTTNGTHFGISTLNAASYDGPTTIAAATALGALPMVIKSSVPNTGGTYRVRIFNGADACFTDQTVTVTAASCTCTPITGGTATSVYADYGTSYFSTIPNYPVFCGAFHDDSPTVGQTFTVVANPSAIAFTNTTLTNAQIRDKLARTLAVLTHPNFAPSPLPSALNAGFYRVVADVVWNYADQQGLNSGDTWIGADGNTYNKANLISWVDNGTLSPASIVFLESTNPSTQVMVAINPCPAVSCTAPSSITFSQVAPTCTGATANNNGTISLATATNGTHFGISTLNAASYDGPTTIATATALGALPMVIKSSVPNAGGTYRVRIFNGADACFTDQTVTVTAVTCVCTPPSASVTGTNTICNGSSTTLTASGGGTYLWSTGEVTAAITVSPSSTTTYTVTVTLSGCTATANRTVTVTQPPSAISFTQVAPTCTGATANNDGTISLAAATNGTHYGISTLNAASYNGPTTIATATAIGALPTVIQSSIPNTGGTYRVRVFNGSNTCFTDQTVTVNAVTCVCTPPSASVTGTNTICNGSSTTLTASGGGTYLWSTGEVTAAITASPAATTTYTVTVTSSGCTATANRTVTVNPIPTASITGTSTLCNGTSTTLTASGGGTYLWSTGAATAAITVSPAINTTYTVTVTSLGCTATASRFVTVNPIPTASITGVNAICNGNSTVLTASGGGTYLWSTGAATAAITVSPAVNTTYTVTVTSLGCTATTGQLVTVTQPPSAIAFSQVPATCTGNTPNNNGSISITTVTGGTHIGFSALNAASYDGPSTIATATALGALPMVVKNSIPNAGGTYRVRVFNGSDGCYTDQTITVAPVSCGACPATAYTLCAGDSYTLTAQSGMTGYQWFTVVGAVETPIAGANSAAYIVTATGIYKYTATDGTGCPTQLCCPFTFITGACCVAPSGLSFTQVAPTCTGTTPNNNGTISLVAATNRTHFGVSTLNAVSYDGPTTIATATAIGALPMVIKSSIPNTGGTYKVRIFNGADGCYTEQTITIPPVNCGTPCTVPSAISFTQVAPTCTGGTSNNNGTISLSAATNGTHFGISTLNAASYDGPTTIATATALGALPMVIKSSVPNTGGTYRVRIFNTADGCYTDQTVTVNPVACCAVPTGLTFTQTAATCTGGTSNNNGTISLSAATNGTHFGISTLNAASYDGPTTIATATALGALPMVIKSSVLNTGGTYLVRVFNTADGCYTDQTVTVNPVACCAVPTGLTFTQTAANCTGGTSNNNGTISLSAATNGTHFGISTLNAASYDGPTTIATATALGALPMVIKSSIPNTGGTYLVRVFNTADGCYADQTVTVNPVVCCAVPTGLTFTQTAATCTGGTSNNNGTISLSAATNGTHFGISTLNAASYDGPTTIATATALGALPMVIKSSVPSAGGTYRVRVFNGADGCYTDQTVTVAAAPCFGAVNGVALIVCSGLNMNLISAPIGGTAPYTYLWSGPSGFTSNIQNPTVSTVTVANSGTYVVTVTEGTGMTATATTSVTILPPGDPNCIGPCINPTNITLTAQKATCNGLVPLNNGTITITAATNVTHFGVSTLNAASYDGPTTIATATLLPGIPMVLKSAIPSTGGTYIIRIFNGQDACYTERIVTVSATSCFGAVAGSTISVCSGADLALVSSPNGGTAPYAYHWSGPAGFTSNLQNPTVSAITTANAGAYNLTVTEGTGLTATSSTTVNVLPLGSPGCATAGPLAVNDALTIPEGGTGIGTVALNDSDPNNTLAELIFSFGNPSSGTISTQPDGSYMFTPSSPDFNGVVIVPYTVCDPTLLCDDAALTITVTPVNDPPVAVNDNATVIKGSSIVIPVLNNDSNGPDGALVPSTVTVTVAPLHGTTFVNSTTGQVTYIPNPSYEGLDVFTYQVCDDGMPAPGACAMALVNITVVPDKDSDGIPDNTDIDDDNDGILDANENPAGYADGGGDLDNDGTPNYKDAQNPNCGPLNSMAVCSNYDKDGDGVPDQFDLDSDNDGLTDVVEAGAADPDNNGIIGTGLIPTDTDQDGLANAVDFSPTTGPVGSIGTPNTDTDGDGKPNPEDLDDDNDGINDIIEAGGSDPDNNGIAGTGITPTDTDLDGLVDVADQSPNAFGDAGNTTPNEDTDGDGKPDSQDIDADNDGITDVVESDGNDPDNNGIAGTGAVPTDTDGDGVPDVADQSVTFGDNGNTTPYSDMDNDGIPNAEDIDSDNDGLTDVIENGISDPDNNGLAGTGLLPTDTDGDGLADAADQSGTYGDAGNSNTPPNTDGTGSPNYLDIDADNDGIVDNIEWQTTVGYVAPTGVDSDGDGLDNAYDQSGSYGDTFNSNSPTNTDGTDNPDYTDTNSDNDTRLDAVEGWDSNGDLIANTTPTGIDIDNDGLDDAFDTNDVAVNPSNGTVPNDYPNFFPSTTPERDWRETGLEICGNGIDDDGDGLIDETCPDFTPTIEMDNVTFLTANVSRDFVINISEIRNAPSVGAIVLKIPKVSGFTYTFSPTATNANVYGGSPVNNALWDMTQNALFITLTLKPGVVLSGYNIYSIGMNATRKANIPTQTNQPITVTIVDESGSDNDDFNNTYNVVIKAQ